MKSEIEEKCKCSNFDKRMYNQEEIFEEFKTLARSVLAYNNPRYKTGFTILLQCPECNSYYLMDARPGQQSFSISQYSTNADSETLIKSFNPLEGIIKKETLDECIRIRLLLGDWLKKGKESRA